MKVAMLFTLSAVVGLASATICAQDAKSELKPIAFSTLDTNKDGKLSLAEARADADLYASFAMLDLNQDGYLTPDEFKAWPRALAPTQAAVRDPTTVPGGSSGSQHMPSN